MKNKKPIGYCLLFASILTLLTFQNLLSQQRSEGEIILMQTGVKDQDEWKYEWRVISSPRWWNDYYLTSNYYSGSTVWFPGNEEVGMAISSPTSPVSVDREIAWGHYKFTFYILESEFSSSFSLDLRDANWSMEQPPYPTDPDTKIRWNDSIKSFEYKNYIKDWTAFDSESNQRIWNFFNIQSPNQEAFQPTSPMIFTCTNPTQTGENPHFEWQIPWQPEDVSFKYKIYRKKDSGSWILQQDNITITEWTDEEVEIDPVHGNTYSYYATAYTNLSPESDPSYVETVHGFRGKNKPFQPDEDFDGITISENEFYYTNYPNPFNPITNISYSVPSDGFVQLKFYNISGQLIKELTNKFHPAGTYQTSFTDLISPPAYIL